MSGMIADDRKNLGHVEKMETHSIFLIRPRPSEIIGDVYDLWFSLVSKIWDGRETAKSPIVWDFPDIILWKLGLKALILAAQKLGCIVTSIPFTPRKMAATNMFLFQTVLRFVHCTNKFFNRKINDNKEM